MFLFGVRIDGAGDELMKKSSSMGNLMMMSCGCGGSCVPVADKSQVEHTYRSDGEFVDHALRRRKTRGMRGNAGRRGNERKRGVLWSEEEHLSFLRGLEVLGKGDWRGISNNFVTTRTSTQVASHAQKHFLKQDNSSQKKRRSSLFDVVIRDNVGGGTGMIKENTIRTKNPTSHSHPSFIKSSIRAINPFPQKYTQSSDLELRIGPPQPHRTSSTKLSSQNIGTLGAISVL